jgi:hypothetical protein
VLTLNQVCGFKFQDFTGSPIHPPSRRSHFPSALDLRRGRALASGETSSWRQAAAPRAGQPPSPSPPSDLRRLCRIWRPGFYLSWLDLNHLFWIWPLGCVPSVAPVKMGPTSQPYLRSLTPPGPPVSARRASAQALARALGSNLGRWSWIWQLRRPDTTSHDSFAKETLRFPENNLLSLVFVRRPLYSCR